MFAHAFDMVKKRLVTFRQVTNLGGPVIHLGVDVNRVFAIPCRGHLFAPDALQICRQRAVTATAEQDISAKGKKQQDQIIVQGLPVYSGAKWAKVVKEAGIKAE